MLKTNICSDLREHLFEVLVPTPPESWPGDEENLFQCGLDSVRTLRLLAFIEEHFGVQLPDHELTPERIGTVSALAELIEEHR
jgi:acyl carrier protein